MTIRIGGSSVYLDDKFERHPGLNFHTTTLPDLTALAGKDRYMWLMGLVTHNLRALQQQLEALAALPPVLRMWRISNDLLPFATHFTTQEFYTDQETEDFISDNLLSLGSYARIHSIRLSFHPPLYVVLGSQDKIVRERAIRELSSYADTFTRMGYTEWHEQGTAINVHVGPKEANVHAMRLTLMGAPKNVLQFLTLENDEWSWTARAIVDTFGDIVPVVLDVHHYWITHEKRVDPQGKLVRDIRDTWRGVQPKLHFAMSKPELCEGHWKPDKPLKIAPLLAQGHKKSKLRVHSEHPWHPWSNAYAASFGFDLMWEGLDRNIGAKAIAKQLGLLKKVKNGY